MLLQIVSFLLDVVAGFLSGACLLRLYMQAQRVSFINPLGQLVLALTDWMVLPLRRGMLSAGWQKMPFDVPSLLAALLAQLVQYLLLWLLWSALGVLPASFVWLPWTALFGLARVAVSGLMGLVLVAVVLSWVQSYSPIGAVVQRLVEPVLRPVRRFMPLIGGVDLSPMVVLVVLQIVMMVLRHWQLGVVLR